MLKRWRQKFGYAIKGRAMGAVGQDSFAVHFPIALLVVFFAIVLRVQLWQWCILLLSITIVLVAEYFNSAIEILVRKLHPDRDNEIAKALDIAAGAVLVAALGAATVGLMIIGTAIFDRWL